MKAILFAITLLAPTSMATWQAYGSFEPDNALDSGSFMWLDAPGETRDRVYFNAFITHGFPGASTPNANVGLLQTNFETTAMEFHQAILGRWIDCNRDGYVGMAESAVREYSSSLLTDKSLCPASTGKASAWNGQPNYNGWVTEFTPIGPFAGPQDARSFRDDAALIWGDYGTPGLPDGRPSCALAAFSQGSARTTGRILDHSDCFLATVTGATTSGVYAAAYNGFVAPTAPQAGLGLADEGWADEAHPLERETLGDQNGDRAIVEAQDCHAPPLTSTGDTPPGDDYDHWEVRAPLLHARPDGTPAGTLNQLFWSMPGGPYDRPGHGYPDDSNCQYHAEANHDGFYEFVESEEPDSHGAVKDAASLIFRYEAQARGAGAAVLTHGGRAGGPADLGIEGASAACGEAGCHPTRWHALSSRARAPPEVVRVQLDPSPSVKLPHASYVTYYAKVGAASTRDLVLPGGSAEYGAEACAGIPWGVRNGWNCDPQAWRPGWGHYRVTGYVNAALPAPGVTYQLRDVDCYDGNVRAIGVAISPAHLGEQPCVT